MQIKNQAFNGKSILFIISLFDQFQKIDGKEGIHVDTALLFYKRDEGE